MIESKEEGIDILNMLEGDGKITHVTNEHEFKDEIYSMSSVDIEIDVK